MNRNDLVVPTSYGNYSVGGDRTVTPRSPKKTSMSPSPSSRSKKSVTSIFGGGGGISNLPKAAPLLEGESMHMALPSFHARTGTRSGTWKCVGCSHENHSALSNECSVCGMTRSLSLHSSQVISESSNCDEDSFQYDGNASENSLSLHNSFSAVDPNLGDELAHAANYSFGHASLPLGLNSSLSSFSAPTAAAATTRFHHSFSVEPSHPRPARSSRGRGGGRTGNRLRGGLLDDNQGHSSVRSFSEWNGNVKIKSWQCPTCTFVNENELHLTCEMCGHLRQDKDGNNTNNNSAVHPAGGVVTVPTMTTNTTATAGNATSNTQDNFQDSVSNWADGANDDPELEELRREQLRELVSLQHEILASLESDAREGSGEGATSTAFSTHDLDREIGQIQAELLSSNHTATQRSLELEHLTQQSDEEEEEDDEEERLQALLANQMEIMKEFKLGRQRTSPILNKKPPAVVAAPPPAQQYHDPLFGGSAGNTAPVHNTAVSLKESMQAAGGKLRIEDICVPLLWGENLSSSKEVSSGKIHA